MSKIYVAISLVAFWVLLPIPLMLAGYGNFQVITPDQYQGIQNIRSGVPIVGGLLAFLSLLIQSLINIATIYLDILLIKFPFSDQYPVIQFIAWVLEFATIITLFLLLRGD